MPASLVEVVRASAGELASGQSITVLPADTILTPAEAAQILRLSRPFVARLLDAGEIDSKRLPGSRHRRVRLADVLAFNGEHDARDAKAAVASVKRSPTRAPFTRRTGRRRTLGQL